MDPSEVTSASHLIEVSAKRLTIVTIIDQLTFK